MRSLPLDGAVILCQNCMRSRAPWVSGRPTHGGKRQTVVQRREMEVGPCAFQGPEEDLEKFREDTSKHGVP